MIEDDLLDDPPDNLPDDLRSYAADAKECGWKAQYTKYGSVVLSDPFEELWSNTITTSE